MGDGMAADAEVEAMMIRYSETERWVEVVGERGWVEYFDILPWRREVVPAARAIQRVLGWPLVGVDEVDG